MAFTRYANAVLMQSDVSGRGWGRVRKTAAAPTRNIMAQAAEILGGPLDPDRYLLTHSTIVASVDVDEVPNVKLGKVKVGKKGFERTVNRKFSDYYIQPQCSRFVNNNGDSWSRQVLLASYPTFIGGHNFLEHLQLEEQSKGRIIDAVARDIGDSVYVDILVATDRKHSQLVKDIQNGKMATLSMGCSVEETICTKCGNVAVDETELCPCIKYEKLNKFHDAQGNQRIIAELCGHPSIEDSAGVHFIEASWVATPAFTGAVLRNILDPTKLPPEMARRVQAALNQLPEEWSNSGSRKVASSTFAFEFGQDEEPEEPESKEPPPNPIDEAVTEVETAIREKAVKKVKDSLKEEDVSEALESSMAPNDTVIKEGYRSAVAGLMRKASSDAEFMDGLASVNHAFGVRIDRDVYRAALKVGSTKSYPSMKRFLAACSHAMGRRVSTAEFRVMVRIGSMLSRLGGNPTPQGVK